jgi:hypothetical protein
MTDPSMNDPQDTARTSGLDIGRRRLFRGVAGGTGVLLSVQAKTALGGGVCKSPSAILSGNTSPRPGDGTVCSGGRSPGFWMQPQHFPHWNAGGVTPPMFNGLVVDCQSGLGQVAWSDITNHGKTFASVFGDEPSRTGGVNYPGAAGLWAVMNFKEGFVGKELLFHIVAAYLNSKYFVSDSAKYPLSPEEVVKMYNDTKGGGLYCPSSFVMQSCPGGGWAADKVIEYIQGMYHINDAVPNLCKGNN